MPQADGADCQARGRDMAMRRRRPAARPLGPVRQAESTCVVRGGAQQAVGPGDGRRDPGRSAWRARAGTALVNGARRASHIPPETDAGGRGVGVHAREGHGGVRGQVSSLSLLTTWPHGLTGHPRGSQDPACCSDVRTWCTHEPRPIEETSSLHRPSSRRAGWRARARAIEARSARRSPRSATWGNGARIARSACRSPEPPTVE